MPKSFSEKERAAIVTELRKAAVESMQQYGVKKTTVDSLAAKAKIPKGTFYLFYKSKELLLFDALTQVNAQLHEQTAESLDAMGENYTVDSLTELLFDFFQLGFKLGVLQMLINGEMNLLIRKLPDDVVAEHIAKDDEFLSVFRKLFPSMTDDNLSNFSAAFRAIFFTVSYRREIGENYDSALKLLIKGLVTQMWSDKND